MEEPAMFKNSMLFVGLDLGDRHSHLVILDQDGELVEEARMPTTPAPPTPRLSPPPAPRGRAAPPPPPPHLPSELSTPPVGHPRSRQPGSRPHSAHQPCPRAGQD